MADDDVDEFIEGLVDIDMDTDKFFNDIDELSAYLKLKEEDDDDEDDELGL
ncbi:MAG TPA: hypothetical protein VI911_07655 [Patescibacteria group bacterium]|nr:hypothetical protein [Patescibacteria group bacterium]